MLEPPADPDSPRLHRICCYGQLSLPTFSESEFTLPKGLGKIAGHLLCIYRVLCSLQGAYLHLALLGYAE